MQSGILNGCTKLLSHRGRGFGYPEASSEAVRAALRSGIRYLELDTRVGVDGVIYARHGARIRGHLTLPHVYGASQKTLAARGVARLIDLLGIAAEMLDPSQTLCLDIKDFGYEREHIELVERFGLGQQTIFLSWIPHVLTRLRAIASRYPLIMSHINLHFVPWSSRFADGLLADREFRIFDYVLLGARAMNRSLRHTIGFQHALVGRDLPDHYVRLLAESGGGICVPNFCVCDALDAWCTRHFLRQWVFTVNNADTYRQLCERPAIQVIFSDEPLRVAGLAMAGSE